MSGYAINKICRRVVQDAAFRLLLDEDPDRALADADPPLTGEERAALIAGDVGRLSLLGAHDFQLAQLQRFGVLGLDIDTYVASMKGAYGLGPELHPRDVGIT